MSTKRTDQITTESGGQFDGYAFFPEEDANGHGILLLQEVFGVGEYIRDVAESLTGLGYAVLAPDLYWRQERGVVFGHGEEDLTKASEFAAAFEWDKGLTDCGAALEHLRGLPEVTGDVAVLGFSFGGTLAFQTAAAYEPDLCVSFYGSGVPTSLDLADKITCPTLFVFGGSDPYIPREAVSEVEKVAAGRDNYEVHVFEEAGHAFHNHASEMFHDAQAAAAAWALTVDFLAAHMSRGS